MVCRSVVGSSAAFLLLSAASLGAGSPPGGILGRVQQRLALEQAHHDCSRPGARPRLALEQAHQGEPEGEGEAKALADSEVIDASPDCGHVKQIIGIWSKAAKVGSAAGLAGGAITGITSAVNVADAALAKIDKIAEDTGGDFEAVKKPLEKASEEATKIQVDLETEKGSLKDEAAASDLAGGGVEDETLVKVRKLTEEAKTAAKNVITFAESALKKAEEHKKDMMKNAGQMEKMIKKFNEAADPLVKECVDIGQKAGFAIDGADKIVKKAEDASGKLDGKIEKAEEQAPVYEALKDNLESAKEAVTEAQDSVKEKKEDLEKQSDDLKEKSKALKEASEKAAGDQLKLKDEGENLGKAERKKRETEAALDALKNEVKTLMKRQDALKKITEEAEAKAK